MCAHTISCLSIAILCYTVEKEEDSVVNVPAGSLILNRGTGEAIIKKDNFELVVQKAVELGVNHIVPILGERSEKKKLNMERLEKIVHEATEQSGRGELMKVYEPTTLPKLFSSGMLPQEKIFFHPEYPPVQDYLSAQTKQYSFAYFIGPEGGFSEEEIELFKKHNINPASGCSTQIIMIIILIALLIVVA